MDDPKRSAHDLYIKYLGSRIDTAEADSFDSDQRVFELREKIQMLIMQYLCTCFPQERFKFPQFQEMILQSSSMDSFEPIKAAEAFVNLESYIFLLCITPWKQEFHQIKKYGGFYQTKIESHLKNADSIFKLIGFSEASAGLLVLTRTTKLEFLQYVAFECFVASTECHIIENVWKRVFDRGLRVTEVVQMRHQNRGTEDDIVSLIELKYGKSVIKGISANVFDCGNATAMDGKKIKSSGHASTDPFRNKLETYMQKAKNLSDFEDIPFIDEGKESEYTPMNLDEQMQASLRLVEGQNASPAVNDPSNPGLRPSQEWSFVREGLEKNYGKQYFEGVRKDILINEPEIRPHQPKINKYVKVSVEHPDPGYVNADAAKQLRKTQQQDLVNSHLFSESRDSDYATGTGSEAFFPPTIDEQSIRKRGSPNKGQVTDTVLAKGYYNQVPDNVPRHYQTAPILRRPPVEQNVYNQNHTHPHYPTKQTQSHTNANSNVVVNMDNIQKYQKRSSAPIADPLRFLPVVNSAPTIAGSRSLSEVMRKNTPDGILTKGAQTIHAVPQQNIPVQTTKLSTHNACNPEWACPYCTYFNTPLTDICEMCSKSRDPNMEVDSPPAAGYSSRICNQCTLENEKESRNCQMCGHELKGTQTVV